MRDELDVEASEGLDPDDAFTLLADETRVRILRALGDAGGPNGSAPLSFSELRERAGVAESGRFNYHLGELVGHFVGRSDEGYELMFPGVRVYRAITAGIYTENVTIPPFELDADCHVCGEPLQARYDNFVFKISCSDCNSEYYHRHLPPSSLEDASRAETLRVVDQRIREHLSSLSNRVCPWCSGRTTATLLGPDADPPYVDDEATRVLAYHECNRCGQYNYTRVGSHLLDHPAVVSFCYERGLDLSAVPVWELAFVSTDDRTEVLSDEPWRIAVTVAVDGDELRVEMDADLRVIETERSA